MFQLFDQPDKTFIKLLHINIFLCIGFYFIQMLFLFKRLLYVNVSKCPLSMSHV